MVILARHDLLACISEERSATAIWAHTRALTFLVEPDVVRQVGDEESSTVCREILPFAFAQGRHFVQTDTASSLE